MDFYNRAMAADPDNLDARSASARTECVALMMHGGSDAPATLAAAEATLTSVLSLVPDHARAHLNLGYVYLLTKRSSECIAECEHALALDRNLAHAHFYIGLSKLQLVRPEEAEAHILEALRLSPRDTLAYLWMVTAGSAKFNLGLYDQALVWLRRSVEANRNHPNVHFLLAATLARLGRLTEAQAEVSAGLALYPNFSVAQYRDFWAAAADDEAKFLSEYEPMYEAMRLAGCPE